MAWIIDILFFAAGMTLFALVAYQQAQVYRDNRVAVHCACGHSVKQLSMISNADVLHYAQLLTNECPRCQIQYRDSHGAAKVLRSNQSRPDASSSRLVGICQDEGAIKHVP